MLRREASLERWCVRWAKARGMVVSKLTDPTGIMDHVFWVPGGRPVLVEFKAEGLKSTALQGYYLTEFVGNGYTAMACDNKELFLDMMKERGVTVSIIQKNRRGRYLKDSSDRG